LGKDLVVFGRGTQRGSDFLDSGNALRGWHLGTATHVQRWGENTVSDIAVDEDDANVQFLAAEFNATADPNSNECHLTLGDSGGAVFINDGGIWKLAGVNYAVDGRFSLDGDPANNGSPGSLFNMGGLYVGGTDEGGPPYTWELVDDPLNPAGHVPSRFYASRISSEIAWIESVIIPEPGTLAMLSGLGAVCLLAFLRRRRS